jgi:tetratricopeptide (TPR) repeat protein
MSRFPLRLLAGFAGLATFAAPVPARAQPGAPVSVPGLGTLTLPTSATVPAARQAFVRGVLLLHVFEYPSAAAAFREAERLEPDFALAYWGEAMTYTHPVWDQQDLAGGRAALAKLGGDPASRASKAPSARERGYLHAAEVLYGDGPKARRDTLYSAAMQHLAAAYPEDDEAKLFYALSLLGLSQGVRNVPTYLRAAAIAESVFARNPHHPGAAHYWIHGMDDPEHAAQALPAARALAGIAPDAAHAQHMTSHIFVALGRWDDVVTANENATRVVNDARRSRGLEPAACGHYNLFLDYGLLQQGRVRDAARLLAACRSQAGSQRPGARDLDPDAYSFITMWSRYVLGTHDWSGEVIRWSVDPGAFPAPRLSYWFTRGFAAARAGDLTSARQALGAYEEAARDVGSVIDSAGAPPSPDDREFLARVEVLRLELVGLIGAGAGDGAAAIDTLRRATAVEDGMAYAFGPPFVNEPSHELLGEQLLKLGRPSEAQREFETALTRTPGRTSVLLGLAHAASAAGDAASAARALGKLVTIWHAADADLPGLAEARAHRPQAPPPNP